MWFQAPNILKWVNIVKTDHKNSMIHAKEKQWPTTLQLAELLTIRLTVDLTA
jgi:hypothetical protein